MKPIYLYAGAGIAAVALAVLFAAPHYRMAEAETTAAQAAPLHAPSSGTPVVLELFTSEGCRVARPPTRCFPNSTKRARARRASDSSCRTRRLLEQPRLERPVLFDGLDQPSVRLCPLVRSRQRLHAATGRRWKITVRGQRPRRGAPSHRPSGRASESGGADHLSIGRWLDADARDPRWAATQRRPRRRGRRSLGRHQKRSDNSGRRGRERRAHPQSRRSCPRPSSDWFPSGQRRVFRYHASGFEVRLAARTLQAVVFVQGKTSRRIYGAGTLDL